jgi:hypothetical protein
MDQRRPEDRKKPKTTNDKLDEALDESFPASDPPAITDPGAHVGLDDEAGKARDKK